MNSGPLADYLLISPSELASRTDLKRSIHLRKLLPTYGPSFKYGSQIRDSARTLIEILESGRNHMADTLALHLQRASHYVVTLIPLSDGACRYFLQQNVAIDAGTLEGILINLNVLGIGNGITVWRSEVHSWQTCCY